MTDPLGADGAGHPGVHRTPACWPSWVCSRQARGYNAVVTAHALIADLLHGHARHDRRLRQLGSCRS
ncbi:hypothetical protein ACRAWD_12635 [Caulobacter segnis]